MGITREKHLEESAFKINLRQNGFHLSRSRLRLQQDGCKTSFLFTAKSSYLIQDIYGEILKISSRCVEINSVFNTVVLISKE